MALFREWVDGEPQYTQLKLAAPPEVVPSGRTGPIYELDSDQASSDEITLLPSIPPKPVIKKKNERRLKSQLASLASRKPVYLPPEIIHRILLYTQSPARVKEEKSLRILKNASLACKAWIDPARRVMFESVRIVNAPGSIARLRSILDRSPELGRAVQVLDLSKPANNRNDQRVKSSEEIRSRFFNALATLKPTTASVTSASYAGHRRRRAHAPGDFESRQDVLALGRLLCDWTSLDTLALTGYSDSPRILGSTIFSQDMYPSYRLTYLSLNGINLAGSTLSRLVGRNCASSLMILELLEVIDLDDEDFKHVLETLGSSLVRLRIEMQSEDGDVDDFYTPSIFAPLNKLQFLSIDSDYFEDAVLDTVVSLPSIETISLNLNSFSYDVVSDALDKASETLNRVCLTDGSQPDPFWPIEERWTLGKSLNGKEIDLSLNHADFEDIDDEWWGVDLSESWDHLERAASQKCNRFRGSRIVQ